MTYRPGFQAVERIAKLGLVPLRWPENAGPVKAGVAAGYSKGFLEVLRLLKFPRDLWKAEVYTTPEAVALMHALDHAQQMWPLQSYREIVEMIGRAGLRTYHAAWVLDAPETDLAELLGALANDHLMRADARRRRRHHR